MAETAETPPAPVTERPRLFGHFRRAHAGLWFLLQVAWSVLAGVAAMLAVIGTVLALTSRDIQIPERMRADISARIEASVGSAVGFEFGGMALVFNRGWRPRVRLEDLVLRRPDGQELLRLTDTEVSFSVSGMLLGELRPKSVLVTGVFAALRRERDGTVALSLGDMGQPVAPADTLPALIGRWGSALDLPVLRSLTGIEINALTLRYEDLGSGRAWTVDSGRVLAQRHRRNLRLSGTFSLLSGRDYASTVEVNYASRIGEQAAEFGFSVTDIPASDIAAQSVALNWLDVVRAPISGSLRGSVAETGTVGVLNATLHIGAGVLQPTDSTRPIPFDQARSYFTYDPAEQKLSFDELSLESAWVSGAGEGVAYLDGIENGTLTQLSGQVSLGALRINPDGLYPEPREIGNLGADFRLELDPFRLSLGQLHALDTDGTLRASGELLAAADGWDLSLDAHMDRVTPKRLLELWPERMAEKPRKWAADNFLAGELYDVDFALRSAPGKTPDLYLDFDFDQARIRFAKWLPPVEGATGTASLAGNRFVATATAGSVPAEGYGAVDATGTSFIIPDTRVKPDTPAITRVEAAGPVAAVIALLNRPPVSALKATTLPVDLAQGWVRATGTLALPMKRGTKFDEIEMHASGTIESVDSTVLVPGHRITAESLNIDLSNDRVRLSGPARISGLPVEILWEQPLGPDARKGSRLSGQVELSERAVEAFNLGLPAGSVKGLGRGTFEIDLAAGKPPALTLTSDLKGVRLAIPSLGWSKPAETPGTLQIGARLGARPVVDRLSLSAGSLKAEGSLTTAETGGLDRASFSSVSIGGWFQGPVDIVGRGQEQPVDLVIRGGALDMQRANFGGSGGETGSIDVSLGKLRITRTMELSNFRGQFRSGKGLTGEFSGLLGGRTPMVGEVLPQDGRSAFRVRSADAGGVLRDSGLLTQARGGDFSMTLTPVGPAGTYEGSARIKNTRVINAPAVAALLDAASIVGLIDELAGSGILFSEVEAKFRLEPDSITLRQGSATGPSMGLSMDGRYDIGADRLAMQGVISPIYLINGIGSVLTRKGEGLIGFSYKLSGAAANPQVQVNPLSALTPGMLRDVFREQPPGIASEDGPPQTGDQTGTQNGTQSGDQSPTAVQPVPGPADGLAADR